MLFVRKNQSESAHLHDKICIIEKKAVNLHRDILTSLFNPKTIECMKKIFTVLCAAMIGWCTANAKVVMTESFDRPVDTLNMGLNTMMGSNTTDWWTYSGGTGATPKFIQVEEGSLSYAGYMTEGVGNKAHLWSTDADDLRQFAPITGGKVYLAAIINVKELRQGVTSDYFLCLGDASASNMYARLYSKSVKEDDTFTGFRLGVSKYSETNTYLRFTEETYLPETNYLVVLEYEFVDGEKNDTARLYVNPTKATTEPTLVCVQDTVNGGGSAAGANAKADASKIASVNLRQGSNTPRQVYIDEIKVATSWEELFEAGATPSGIDEVEVPSDKVPGTKVLRDGQLYLIYGGRMYDVQGKIIQ